jgi:hypothetical protein
MKIKELDNLSFEELSKIYSDNKAPFKIRQACNDIMSKRLGILESGSKTIDLSFLNEKEEVNSQIA